MNRGKHTCEYLKEVRRRVARENDIPLEQPACTFEGECSGTCPRCEAEVRYIESELRKRSCLGKAVSIAGIALSSVVAVGCHPNTLQGEPELNPDDTVTAAADTTAVSDTLRDNPADTLTTAPKPSWYDYPEIYCGGLILEDYNPEPIFPEQYGTPASWLKGQIKDSATLARIHDRDMDDIVIHYLVNPDGTISDVSFFPSLMASEDPEDEAFVNTIERIMLTMPLWEKSYQDHAFGHEIPVKDLR